MIPDVDPASDPDCTVVQLKEALVGAEVEYTSDARKANPVALAEQHNV
jgi:hypothetical protein